MQWTSYPSLENLPIKVFFLILNHHQCMAIAHYQHEREPSEIVIEEQNVVRLSTQRLCLRMATYSRSGSMSNSKEKKDKH
jgi:hypothetical protein